MNIYQWLELKTFVLQQIKATSRDPIYMQYGFLEVLVKMIKIENEINIKSLEEAGYF